MDGPTRTLPPAIKIGLSSSLPLLPEPLFRLPAQGSGAASCATLVSDNSISVLSRMEFADQYKGASGGKPIAFCREGFFDVLLIDTGVSSAVCTAVRVAAGWALTAGHCVRKQIDKVRIFQPTPETSKCLERAPKSTDHPADVCKMTALPRQIHPARRRHRDRPRADQIAGDKSRSATIISFDASKPFEMTLAGSGQSPAGAEGRLRVGWTEIHEKEALEAMAGGVEYGGLIGPLVTIERDASDNAALRSWSCPGDSGAPFYAGQIFGWEDEPHNVAAINVRGTAEHAGCRPQVEEGTNTGFVFLHQAKVRTWLCDTTQKAIEMCKTP